jgi:hypothetical protein
MRRALQLAPLLLSAPGLAVAQYPAHEREIRRVPQGRAVVIPLSEATRGHGSHTIASLWK